MRSNTRETMARRDNFKQSVIDILFKRSGGKCCKCRVSTFGPHTGKYDKYQNIGQAAHIAAAAPGGPRYEKKMAPEERTSAKNGLWLCSNCHSEVDKDSDKFTVIALRRIKKEGEERARREIGVAPVVSSVDTVDDADSGLLTAVSATTIVEIRKVKSSLLTLHGEHINRDTAERLLEQLNFINLKVDTYHHRVGAELIGFFASLAPHCHDAEINLEIVRQFQSIMERFDSHWTEKEVELVTNTLQLMSSRRSSTVSRSALALLKNMARNRTLASKKLHSIPLACLRELREGKSNKKGGSEDVDYESKFAGAEPTPENVSFISWMVGLAEATSEEDVLSLEGDLTDLGYEYDII